MVPSTARKINAGRFSFLQEKPALLLYNKINAIVAATRFLKKLFSIDGRSPDSFTHKFIIEKPNAEIKIHEHHEELSYCAKHCLVKL